MLFLEHLSIWNMLNNTEQMQKPKDNVSIKNMTPKRTQWVLEEVPSKVLYSALQVSIPALHRFPWKAGDGQ